MCWPDRNPAHRVRHRTRSNAYSSAAGVQGFSNGVDRTNHWAGQAAVMATAEPAGDIVPGRGHHPYPGHGVPPHQYRHAGGPPTTAYLRRSGHLDKYRRPSLARVLADVDAGPHSAT